MKIQHLFTLIFLFICVVQSTAQQHTIIHPNLLEKIEQAPNDFHHAYILLADRVDADAMDRRFNTAKTSQKERIAELIPALQSKAAATQPALIEYMRNSEHIEEGSIKPLWITNAIFFKGNKKAIENLSRMPEIAFIDENWQAEIVGVEKAEASAEDKIAKIQNIETGLHAINAPAMWAMGYTGYGRKGMIIDTGEEGDHPAIRNQYWGHWVPHDEAWSGTGTPSPCIEDNGDLDGHGTHVTGTVVGLDRINEDTIGVAFDAHWIAGGVELSGCNGFVNGSALNIAQTFQWSLNPDNNVSTTADIPDVINNSWGRTFPNLNDCDGYNAFTLSMCNALYAAGIAVVFAAGNEGPDAQSVRAPAFIAQDTIKTFSVGNINANNSSWPINTGSSRGPTPCSAPAGSLKIKPEVSAPGTNVRSSVPGKTYDLFTGTSMASPHVSGAILLLKEAFPNLSGSDLKFALYHTCIDLGATGEDNVYGMGMIDVKAAYDYLINKGYTPEPPASRDNDVILLDVVTPSFHCDSEVSEITVFFENGGQDTLTSLEVITTIGGNTNTANWTGSVAPGERESYIIPAFPASVLGNFDMFTELQNPNAMPDMRPLNNRLRTGITLIDGEKVAANVELLSDTLCKDSRVALRADAEGEGVVVWYDEPEGGSPVGEGDVFITDPLSMTETYYADFLHRTNVGKIPPNISDLQINNETGESLFFDCYHPFTLKTVTVFADEPGARLISIKRGDGSGIKTQFVDVPKAGKNIVDIDANIPVGNGHSITLLGTRSLYHNFLNTEYPYEVDNVVSIYGSSHGVPASTYYYFYDWEIEYNHLCGRTPVEVTVGAPGNLPNAAIEPTDTTIDLSVSGDLSFVNNSTDATVWMWDFGDGNTSTEETPTHTYTQAGTYYASMTAQHNDGCTDAAVARVRVVDEIVNTKNILSEPSNIQIYPNPTEGVLFVQFDEEN